MKLLSGRNFGVVVICLNVLKWTEQCGLLLEGAK